MFGSIGGPEIFLIFILALLLFGPRKIPEIGRVLGKTVAEFRKATNEFRATLEREVEMEKLKETRDSLTSAGNEAAGVARDAAYLGTLGIPALPPAAAALPYGSGEPPASPPPAAVEPPTAASPASRVPVPFSDDPVAPSGSSSGTPPAPGGHDVTTPEP